MVGPQEHMKAICIHPESDMEKMRAAIIKAATEVDQGKGVVLLTDMFGGTPSNLAISVMDDQNVEVIAGVNLPMLIKLISLRSTESLKEAALQAQEAGRKYINVASNLLSKTS
ncbi:MAG: PTS fructose transporter subunit IIA [Alphaproteobacteria bacterium]|nr:PTS fructose transporter subunit IIA [Alphaproteobacteria bacterium]